jgi:hypothetical protein
MHVHSTLHSDVHGVEDEAGAAPLSRGAVTAGGQPFGEKGADMRPRSNRGPQRPVRLFSAADCRFGATAAAMRIRVEHVAWSHPVRYDGERWYPVRGVVVAADGTDGQLVTVLVRGRALGYPKQNVREW